MLDKQKTIKQYIRNLEMSLDSVKNICTSSSRNLILINANSSFIVKLVCSRLKEKEFNLYLPQINEINQYGSLGNLLRNNVNSTANILILDFQCELRQLSDNITNTINANRDLFTQVFNSTIIFAPLQMIYKLRHSAMDFWSCINLYVDLTKWYCTPIPLPIVKIRISANADSYLIDFFKKDNKLYNNYISLYEYINNIKKYNYNLFEDIFIKIKKFPDGIGKIKLINKFGEVITGIQVNKGLTQKHLTDISSFILNTPESVEYIDMIIICAEFYYRYGLYEKALLCYQKATYILDNKWSDDKKEVIMAFLSCNKLICKYLKADVHNPNELLNEFKMRLNISLPKDSNEITSLIRNYLFLINCTVQHHSYSQHKDIYIQLKENSLCTLSMLDFSETQNICMLWEKFINNNFIVQYNNIGDTVLTEIHLKIQEMIHYFCNNDYFKARQAYKIAAGLSKNYGYIQMYNIISTFNKNMIYLSENQ